MVTVSARSTGSTALLKEMCNHPDGNMFLPITASGDEAYLYTNYECRPGTVGKIYMKTQWRDWDVLDGENVGFASVKGTWNNCNASVTPWNTGLTSEEYEPVAAKIRLAEKCRGYDRLSR